MTFRLIRDHREYFPVRLMCRGLGGLAQRLLRLAATAGEPTGGRTGGRGPGLGREDPSRPPRQSADLRQPTRTRQPGSRCGGATAAAQGKAEGYRIGRNRVTRLMRENGIRARTQRKFKVTTDSRHDYPVAPNRLDRQFTVQAPNTVWVADLSYIWTREGWLYLVHLGGSNDSGRHKELAIWNEP